MREKFITLCIGLGAAFLIVVGSGCNAYKITQEPIPQQQINNLPAAIDYANKVLLGSCGIGSYIFHGLNANEMVVKKYGIQNAFSDPVHVYWKNCTTTQTLECLDNFGAHSYNFIMTDHHTNETYKFYAIGKSQRDKLETLFNIINFLIENKKK